MPCVYGGGGLMQGGDGWAGVGGVGAGRKPGATEAILLVFLYLLTWHDMFTQSRFVITDRVKSEGVKR